VNVVDVRDVADGHARADRHGKVGERYILGGRNFTFDRLFADLGRLSGVEPPIKVPSALAMAAAALLQAGPGSPLTPQEVRTASQWWTHRSTKARRSSAGGPVPTRRPSRPPSAGTLEREYDRIARTRRSQQVQYRVAGAALGALEDVAGAAAQLWRRAGAVRP
jgi:dihydroflavonol-4-reductase